MNNTNTATISKSSKSLVSSVNRAVKDFFGIESQAAPQVKFNRRKSDRPLTEAQVREKYKLPRSLTDMMPWVEYLPDSQCFLLDDYKSVGAVYDIKPTACEGRPEQFLRSLQENIKNMLCSVPERDHNPWVMQIYVQDDDSLLQTYERLEQSIPKSIRETEFTQQWLQIQKQHLEDISHTTSLFYDDQVTDNHWSGKTHRVRMVFYRRQGKNEKLRRGLTPEIELNNTLKKVESMLKAAGIQLQRATGEAFFYWMLRWFNPRPPITKGDPDKFEQLVGYSDEDLPTFHDFSEGLLFSMPRSDDEKQCWYFDGIAHRIITVERLKRVPSAGHMTAEREQNEYNFAFMDRMPPGTVYCMSIIFKPQDVIANHLNRIMNASVGSEDDSILAAEEAAHAKRQIAMKNNFYPVNLSFYIKADTVQKLDELTYEMDSLLIANDLHPIDLNSDLLTLDSYLRNLPMAYDVEFDEFSRRSRLLHSMDIAALSGFFGRSTGTGHTGLNEFNRGGEALFVDPFRDRKQNAHLLTLGPTGAGKSAYLVKIIRAMFAIHRPRIFIIESGNSFGLLADDFQRLGVSVNQLSLKPGTKIAIPPFRDAVMLLKTITQKEVVELDDEDNLDPDNNTEQEQAETRDQLGEMEIAAKIMITGGDEKERFSKSDRLIVRQGIYRAAEQVASEGRNQTMITDVVNGIRAVSHEELTQKNNRNKGERASELADAMELFCDGFTGELFNQESEYWPEVDVTVLDLAYLTKEGYETELAVAYTGLMNAINNIIEKYEYDPRPTIVLTDEGHVITKNPLLAPYVVKITKMWRKLGAWYWIATQNMKDFPNAAETMLNMIEWWVCLAMPADEIEQIARFKTLTREQKTMMLSAKKAPHKYNEGVIMSKEHNILFRNVPPAIDLALAMTEKEEKAERFELMREYNLDSELDAAYKKAELIRAQRLSQTVERVNL